MPAPAKRPRHTSLAAEAILSLLHRRGTSLAPTTVAGFGVYAWTGRIRDALLVCVLGPPAVKAGRVLAAWIELAAPPRRWRRPRRRGS